MWLGLWFGLGLLAWTFVEYLLHGWLGHRASTLVAAIHDAHHRDPHAVFAVGAWLPLAAAWLILLVVLRVNPAVTFLSGILFGFAGYEAIHYRLHFCAPGMRWEAALRARHLLHHRYAPARCYGVTTPFWDWIFRTNDIADNADLLKRAAAVRPLAGPTNARMMLRYWTAPRP